MWKEPKTNWVQDDYFNLVDYKRITDNLSELYFMAKQLYPALPTMAQMPVKSSFSDIIYASDMNAIENNLHLINDNTLSFDIGQKMTFSVNGSTPTFEEFNRIERAIKLLYETMQVQYKMIPRLAIILGGENRIKL